MKTTAINLAISELITPSFETTRQHLEDHELVIEAGQPVVVCVDENLPDAFVVYFQLKSVEYFLAIPVYQSEGTLKLGLAYLQAQIEMSFNVYSDALTPDEISKQIGLSPTRVRYMGEPIKEGGKPLPHHFWSYGHEIGIPGDLNEKLANLIAILESVQEGILGLAAVAKTAIRIYYVGNSDFFGGLHFDTEIIQRIAALGCDIDFGPYLSSPRGVLSTRNQGKSLCP